MHQWKAKTGNWFKAQVNKLNNIMKDVTQPAGISGKTNHGGRKALVQKLLDSGVPPNQIIQITGHKNLQSVNNYSCLREKQMESISRILSSTTKAATNVAQTENNLTAQPQLSIESLQRLPLHLPWM